MSKRKLLLADDSVTIQKVVNLTFADEGIEVISVGDGDSAMEMVAELSPDLIMADVNMPGLTGYEICERIRQDENLRQTPVILLVGSFEPFDEDEARRVGADDYLTKPFQSIRQLVNKVTVLLNSKNSENGDAVAEIKDASSLEDTLEMDVEDYAPATQPVQYGDTGYDDEMIQTNRPAGFAFDETQKFESKDTEDLIVPPSFEAPESEDEDLLEDSTPFTSEEPETTEEIVPESESISDEFEEEIVSGNAEETEKVAYEINEESLSPEIERNGYTYQTQANRDDTYEIKEEESVLEEIEEREDTTEESISYKINEDESVLDETEENIPYEIEDEETTSAKLETGEIETNEMVEIKPENDEVEFAKTTYEEEIPLPEFASVLESDEDDILQLPPIESDFEDEEEEEEIKPTVETATSPVEATSFVSAGESNNVIDSAHISPELIDAIVQKVLERLSEKAIKEVAWEVVPQMTELIVKKMAEERLKG